MDDETVGALRRAVDLAPDDVALRALLAETLLRRGDVADAISEAAAALSRDGGNERARQVMTRAFEASAPDAIEPAEFDWSSAEADVDGIVPPRYLSPDAVSYVAPHRITLADVGGMQAIKDRLEVSFLAPLRNPELRALYGTDLRGGLLMYGPPGCGKTHLARAIAGELDASFVTAGLQEVLDPYIGNSEQNIHEIFEQARALAPCVLFLDEIDAIGIRRAHTRNSGLRGVVVQLLQELDGINSLNDGVFVLAASNQPWDIDTALRRPGRLDRTLLVLPPDESARRAIFEINLRDRPVENVDLDDLVARTDGFTGADISYICRSAAELALLDSARSGTPRNITGTDLSEALTDIRSSAIPWLDSVRNLVSFGEDDGTFDELRVYLKRSRRSR